MLTWKEWGSKALQAARQGGRRILLLLPSGRVGKEELERAFAPLNTQVERFVYICAEQADRPELYRRYGAGGEIAAVLSPAGAVLLSARDLSDLPKLLTDGLTAPPHADPAQDSVAVWSGAVTTEKTPPLSDDRPQKFRDALVSAARPLSCDPQALEFLLYWVRERGDEPAKNRLVSELSGLVERGPFDKKAGAFLEGDLPTLGVNAVFARLYYDAHAVTGVESFRQTGRSIVEFVVRELFDADSRAFRHQPSPAGRLYADANAMAALALQRAAAAGEGPAYAQAADEALAALRERFYDPMLGVIHRHAPDGELVYGLLGDAAASALAFTEAFLRSGHKPHREFADQLMQWLFQELWDRDRGGFLDGVARADDVGLLREPRPGGWADQAAAFEALWRLHHLKGNANYKRWLDWGLRAVQPPLDAPGGAGLARVQDMLARGRADFELVGKRGEEGTESLLSAVGRCYAPRRVVSFVDPDDQDYILAHKLSGALPRLFACGPDLRAIDSTDQPGEVPRLVDRVTQLSTAPKAAAEGERYHT